MSDSASPDTSAALARRQRLPRLEDIPIPLNCRIDRRWPALMEEMADHIGAYATVQIAEAFGGQYLYVSANIDSSPFTPIIGRDLAQVVAQTFASERIAIPPMRDAIRHIRICRLIRLVRVGRLSTSDAAAIANIAVRHMSSLVNSDEYVDDYPLIDLPEPRDVRLLRGAGEIVQATLLESNMSSELAHHLCERIMSLANQGNVAQPSSPAPEAPEIEPVRP